MVEANVIIGLIIIVINLLPFIFRKPRLLLLTGAVSVFLVFLLLSGWVG